jgi:hypothetical protein
VPVETISAAARPFGEPDGTVNITSLENQQVFFREQGRLTYEQPLDIASLINASYAQEAVKSLGRSQAR